MQLEIEETFQQAKPTIEENKENTSPLDELLISAVDIQDVYKKEILRLHKQRHLQEPPGEFFDFLSEFYLNHIVDYVAEEVNPQINKLQSPKWKPYSKREVEFLGINFMANCWYDQNEENLQRLFVDSGFFKRTIDEMLEQMQDEKQNPNYREAPDSQTEMI